MNLIIEFIHEHILAIDFAMFVLIWFVQLIAYPVLEMYLRKIFKIGTKNTVFAYLILFYL